MDELTSALTGEPCCGPEKQCLDIGQQVRDRTVIGQLTEKKNSIERDLEKVNAALDALQADPKLADALTKIGKAMQVRY